MIPEEYSEYFLETFYEQPVTINTKIQIVNEEGNDAILSYSGILVDIDMFFFYIGRELHKPEIAISVDDISNIVLFNSKLVDLDSDDEMILQ